MDRKKDPGKQMSLDDLLREAEEIDREIAEANMDPMPLEIKERIRANLNHKIDEYEKEHSYASLSEEDRKALEVGRKVLKEKGETEAEEKVVYRKKKIRMYHMVAAVLLLVLALGVTSMGGTERVIEMMKVAIGTRGVTIVDTEEDNYVTVDDNEEAAYQELEEVFGVALVRPTQWPNGTVFETSYVEEEIQMALLLYQLEGQSIQFCISSHYMDSSWGIDNEDKVTGEYGIEHSEKGKLLIREGESRGEKTKSYSVQFTHNGLEYYLTGVMKKDDFNNLVKNLKFF